MICQDWVFVFFRLTSNTITSNSEDVKFNPPIELTFSKDVVIFTLREFH